MRPPERMSVAEFRRLGVKAAKYGNSKTVVDGIRFDSKLEMERYLQLKNFWHLGLVRWFTRQVPFHLPGGIIYRADFLVVPAFDEQVRVEDCKGFMTRVSINKIKQVEDIYGLKVRIITKETKGDAWQTSTRTATGTPRTSTTTRSLSPPDRTGRSGRSC